MADATTVHAWMLASARRRAWPEPSPRRTPPRHQPSSLGADGVRASERDPRRRPDVVACRAHLYADPRRARCGRRESRTPATRRRGTRLGPALLRRWKRAVLRGERVETVAC